MHLRDVVREHVLRRAEEDPDIVAAAAVGSLTQGAGDRWSDLDLTFGVTEGSAVEEVLAAWTEDLAARFAATHLLDVASGEAVYRVFLLEDWLQVDLSFAPRAARRMGPKFAPLFGPHEVTEVAAQPSTELFGWAVLATRHALVALERGLPWHAEYSIGLLRDNVLALACLRRDLPARFAKGVDRLPPKLRAQAEATLVGALEHEALTRSLAAAIELLLAEAAEEAAAVPNVRRQLEELARG